MLWYLNNPVSASFCDEYNTQNIFIWQPDCHFSSQKPQKWNHGHGRIFSFACLVFSFFNSVKPEKAHKAGNAGEKKPDGAF